LERKLQAVTQDYNTEKQNFIVFILFLKA